MGGQRASWPLTLVFSKNWGQRHPIPAGFLLLESGNCVSSLCLHPHRSFRHGMGVTSEQLPVPAVEAVTIHLLLQVDENLAPPFPVSWFLKSTRGGGVEGWRGQGNRLGSGWGKPSQLLSLPRLVCCCDGRFCLGAFHFPL